MLSCVHQVYMNVAMLLGLCFSVVVSALYLQSQLISEGIDHNVCGLAS